MKKKLLLITVVIVLTHSLAGLAYAQSLFPEFVQDLLRDWEGADSTQKLSGFIRLALTLAFGIVVLAAVAYSIIAAINYIRSQGDAGKVEEANKAIKAIFQGVVAMFVGIIGVVLVFFIFDVVLPDPSLPPVCVKYPESNACRVCSEGERSGQNRCFTFPDGQRRCASVTACSEYTEQTSFSF